MTFAEPQTADEIHAHYAAVHARMAARTNDALLRLKARDEARVARAARESEAPVEAPAQPRLTPLASERVRFVVSRVMHMSWGDITCASKECKYLFARYVAITALRRFTGLNLSQIGILVRRDRTTVLHALFVVAAMPATYEPMLALVAAELERVETTGVWTA